MQTYQVGLIALGLAAIGIFFAYFSWKKARSNQEKSLNEPHWIETENSSGVEGFYVATTFAGEPLNRVSAYGLGARGRVGISLETEGLELHRVGERSFQISWASIKGLDTNSAVIDRAVERDGLVSVSWTLGQSVLETHLRIVNGEARKNLLNELSEKVL
ncbi:MAG: hypothetical protein ACKOXT_01830 [Actinomycetota bacterium]